jgi:hypothetical protein
MSEVFIVSEGPFASRCKQALVGLGAAATMAACGGEPPAFDGYRIEMDTQAPWAQESDAEARVRNIVDDTIKMVNAPPDALDGVTIKLVDGSFKCGYIDNAGGCSSDNNEIKIDADVACPEKLTLAHETLHQILRQTTGDADDHHDQHPELWREVPGTGGTNPSCPVKR